MGSLTAFWNSTISRFSATSFPEPFPWLEGGTTLKPGKRPWERGWIFWKLSREMPVPSVPILIVLEILNGKCPRIGV